MNKMTDFILVTFYLLLHIISGLSDTSQCQMVCRKTNKVKKNNNIEVFLEFRKSLIKVPNRTNYVEENRMLTLPNGEIIPGDLNARIGETKRDDNVRHIIGLYGVGKRNYREVSMRLPSEFIVDPVAGNNANCASKEFLSRIKELRKNIKCTPRPVIVDVISTEGEVFPSKVLTKQCSGLCNGRKVCTAVKTVNTSLPVQILYDDGNMKCSTILVPEDTKCKCKCSVMKENCTVNQKYDKKSCQCKCKNEVERNHCLRKATLTQQHYWDAKNCSCACMNETPCTTGTFWDKARCRCSKKADNG